MKTDACITKKNLNLHISCAKHLLADRKIMFLDMLCSKMQFVDNWKQQLRASVWQLLLCQTFQSWRPTAVELQCRCRTPRIPPNCLAWRGSARGVSSASFHSLWTCRKECGTFPGAPAPSAPAHHRDGWGGGKHEKSDWRDFTEGAWLSFSARTNEKINIYQHWEQLERSCRLVCWSSTLSCAQ